jgi:Tol biopolymer transport system component
MTHKKLLLTAALIFGGISLVYAQLPDVGTAVSPSSKEQAALAALKGKVTGEIVWSTSRVSGKHDLFIMNADGTNPRPLTKGGNVDWFPRFSPSGALVVFTRSKVGWVSEMDAEYNDKWDVYTIKRDGTNEKKAAEDATWATWRPDEKTIVFSRRSKVCTKNLETGKEDTIFDTEAIFHKKGVIAQEPNMSPSGNCLALTLRGTMRETGVWNFDKKEWYKTGGGCQIDWFPSGKRVLRMNEGQGNGGTEVLAFDLDENGKPIDKIEGLSINKKWRFMDLPGRRSHEYFPKMDQTGQWLVWCATQVGHEHDLADYEVYIWDINTDKEKGPVRITFHTGNDRWPDIHIGSVENKTPEAPASAPQ